MELPVQKRGLVRGSAFGFTCHRCLGCCRHKRIQLNPYEIARLARNRGTSTTGFITAFTTAGGSILRAQEEGACVFLGSDGCLVHPDRPLVCRLYPLGRHVDLSGGETFSLFAIEPGSRSLIDEHGVVATYLDAQGAAPFMHAADRYYALLRDLLETLVREADGEPEEPAVLATVAEIAAGDDSRHDLSRIDMDRAVAQYCSAHHLAEPPELDARMELHIRALREWTSAQPPPTTCP